MDMLVITPSAPMVIEPGGLLLDIKMVDGLKLYADLWPGPVRCLMRTAGSEAIPFGRVYTADELPCEMLPVGPDLAAHRDLFDGAAAVLASGDNFLDFPLVSIAQAPVAFIIENVIGTRLRITTLDHGWSAKSVKSMIWTLMTERRRRAAFARAAGLQANGTPAFDAYRALSPAPMLFFDSRLREDQQISAVELDAKAERLLRGEPLRLVFSGRLEPIKGVDHLVPVARALLDRGVDFTFDIYGSGSLREPIARAIAEQGLDDRMRLHGAVPFDDVLVPTLKAGADLFACCHRQGDPSCTYQETMGCGVPMVGYSNAAFEGVLREGNGGLTTPLDRPGDVAAAIAALDRDRPELIRLMRNAAAFSQAHSMENGFAARVRHLRAIARS